jgi:phosphatidylglycerol lysyltransferase
LARVAFANSQRQTRNSRGDPEGSRHASRQSPSGVLTELVRGMPAGETRRKPPVVIAITLATLASGALNLYSLVHPADSARLKLLHELLPLAFVRLSRFMTLTLGFALVISALNIYKRKRRAFQVVLGLLALSILFHITQGLDYEEALLSLAFLGLLLVGRRHFTVRSRALDLRSAVERMAVALLVGVGYGVAGFWLLDPREFGINFSLRQAVHQTLLAFVLATDPGLVPHTRHAVWFLDSLTLMTTIVLGYSLSLLFRPVLYRLRTVPQQRVAAAAIVREHGRSNLDFFKLWPDKSFFFSGSGQTVVAYSVGAGCALALGDPVGPEHEIEGIVRDFSRFCADNDWRLAFYQTLPDFLPAYNRCGLARLKLGDEAIVDLRAFTLEAGLRKAVRKVERLGIQARFYDPPLPDRLVEELRTVSDDWLRIPGRRERQFTLGHFDLDYVRASPVLVAAGGDGDAQAFVNIIPCSRKGDTTIDLMRRRRDAPNGIMDFLLARLMLLSRERGFERFCFGLAPMSGFDDGEDASPEERAIHFFFRHLTFIFSFSGLRAYKTKFATDWEPRYIIHRHVFDLPRVALALARVSEIR